jgi:hypothetical protein
MVYNYTKQNLPKEYDTNIDIDKEDPYEIKIKKTNKDKLTQPISVKNDIFPTMPCGCLVVGKSGSGKTQVIVNILSNSNLLKGYFTKILLFSDTKPDKELIDDLNLDKKNIITDFTEEDVEKVINEQEKVIAAKGFNKSEKVIMIFDDILSKPKFLKSKVCTKLATANRHYNISYIFSTQYYKKVPPVIRTNSRYYIIFPSSMSEIEKIAQELCPPQMSQKKFIKYIQYATEKKYSFMSINTDSEEPLRRMFDNILI